MVKNQPLDAEDSRVRSLGRELRSPCRRVTGPAAKTGESAGAKTGRSPTQRHRTTKLNNKGP